MSDQWRYANDFKGDRLVIVFRDSGAVHGIISEGGEDNPVGLTRRLKLSAGDVEPVGQWRSPRSLPKWASNRKPTADAR